MLRKSQKWFSTAKILLNKMCKYHKLAVIQNPIVTLASIALMHASFCVVMAGEVG